MSQEPETVDDFSLAVREAISPIERGVRVLAGDVEWSAGDRSDAYFDSILSGQRGVDTFRVYLKILVHLGPADVQAIADYAGQVCAGEAGGLHRERHLFLLIAREIEDPAAIRGAVQAFNQERWCGVQGRAPRAALASSSLDDERPRMPGVEGVEPDLSRLDLFRILLDATVGGRAVSSAPPGGVAAAMAADASQVPPEPDAAAMPSPPSQEGRPVVDLLVVDDDPLVREMLKDTLELTGHRVHTAEDWVSFRKVVFDTPPAVIVLDVNLPGLSGERVALAAGMVRPPKPRVILHSGIDEGELRRMARRVGALNYIPKGVEIDRLLEAVEAGVDDFLEDADSGV